MTDRTRKPGRLPDGRMSPDWLDKLGGSGDNVLVFPGCGLRVAETVEEVLEDVPPKVEGSIVPGQPPMSVVQAGRGFETRTDEARELAKRYFNDLSDAMQSVVVNFNGVSAGKLTADARFFEKMLELPVVLSGRQIILRHFHKHHLVQSGGGVANYPDGKTAGVLIVNDKRPFLKVELSDYMADVLLAGLERLKASGVEVPNELSAKEGLKKAFDFRGFAFRNFRLGGRFGGRDLLEHHHITLRSCFIAMSCNMNGDSPQFRVSLMKGDQELGDVLFVTPGLHEGDIGLLKNVFEGENGVISEVQSAAVNLEKYKNTSSVGLWWMRLWKK